MIEPYRWFKQESVRKYGITETCKAFDVSQDVGLSIWAWQHQLYHIHMPKGDTPGMGEFEEFKPDAMFIHAVKHFKESDDCDGVKDDWDETSSSSLLRYNQSIMVGCGHVDRYALGIYIACNYSNHSK